jgi:hypothetical protein
MKKPMSEVEKEILVLQRALNTLESIELDPDNFEEVQKICIAKGILDAFITIKRDC